MLVPSGYVGRVGQGWPIANSGVSIFAVNGTSYPGNVTFTRASAANQINSTGTGWESVGNDVPRFDRVPGTGAWRGQLLEPQRTNLLLNSETLSTQNVTVTAQAYTLSFYGTGTITLSGASTAGPLVGTGAFPNEVTLTFTPSAGTLTLTVSGSVTFAQLEAGSFATSWITTTGATATRAADVALITDLSTIGYNALEGTLVAEWEAGQTGSNGVVARFDDTGDGSIIAINQRNTTTPATFANRDAFTTNVDIALGSGAAVVGTIYKVAGAYKVNDYAASLNGGTVGTDTVNTVPTLTRMRIGSRNVDSWLGGWLRSLTYYPTRLSNADLQRLST